MIKTGSCLDTKITARMRYGKNFPGTECESGGARKTGGSSLGTINSGVMNTGKI